MAATPWYATREHVLRALDVDESAHADWQVDDALASATESVLSLTHRVFYPQLDTRVLSFDWRNRGIGGRLWLDDNELISATSILDSSGASVAPSTYRLMPDGGPPYTWLEPLTSSFGYGDVTVTGLFGFRNDTVPAGILDGALDAITTSVTVSNGAAVGVGDLLEVGTERMVVTGRTWYDSTAATTEALEDSTADTMVGVSPGAVFWPGEELLLDAERVSVQDVAGDNVVVKRAFRGSVLDAHLDATDVFVSRTLTVERGACGTTATAHLDAATLRRWVAPAPVRTLTVAEAMATFAQERSGYAAVTGGAETSREAVGAGLAAARRTVIDGYARMARKSAI